VATASTTQTKYDQQGVRENLIDRIYDVSPMDTPVMTAIGRGPAATNTKVECQNDAVRAAGTNKRLDGDDVTYRTRTPTTKPCNYTQLMDEGISVSSTAQAVKTAGRRQELLYQVKMSTKALKRDMESAICGNAASDDGSRLTARGLGGFESWFRTNVDRGSGGASGGFTTSTSQTVAATDASASNIRTFTETRAKSVIRSIWDNSDGGAAPLIVVGSFVKTKASAFAGIATPQQQYPMGPKSAKALAIIGAADIYVSDFGKHRIVPSRFSRSRSALFLNPEYAELAYLQPFKVTPLAKTGHADKRMLAVEFTLRVNAEKALGVCADLKTS
jgi:hypothetical protein